ASHGAGGLCGVGGVAAHRSGMGCAARRSAVRETDRRRRGGRCDDDPMKAAVYTRYGPPDVVEVKDVDKPVPTDDEVLIAIRAASVNAMDLGAVRGTPFLVRMMFGLSAPKDTRLGVDVAGVVEAVGGNVTRFKPGDAVFGNCRGAFAEYRCAAESALDKVPDG